MDKTEHAIIGALSAIGFYGLYKHIKNEKPTIQGALGSLLLGGFAGVLPDILEPATSPNHRSFFHSVTLLSILTPGNLKGWQLSNLTNSQKLALSIFSTAYCSHILSDSNTPKSIPLLL